MELSKEHADAADGVLNAIHARSPLSDAERSNLREKLLRRDQMDYGSLQRFFIGDAERPVAEAHVREMVETAVREQISTVLARSMAT